VANLRKEGIRRGVHRVGDVMVDAVRQNLARARRRVPNGLKLAPRSYYLATLHRQENVDDPGRLRSLIDGLSRLPAPVLLPLHPRTRDRLRRLRLRPGGSVRVLQPVPYLSMLYLASRARAVVTDSGGLQKEAFILRTPCVTLRDTTEWVETLEARANRLVGADAGKLVRAATALETARPRWGASRVYGDGRAAEATAAVVARFLEDGDGRDR
jgi:UDP-N-acetylglucosamine 2-epimerase